MRWNNDCYLIELMSKLNEDIIKALVPSKHMAVVIIILLLFLPAQHLFTIFFFFLLVGY